MNGNQKTLDEVFVGNAAKLRYIVMQIARAARAARMCKVNAEIRKDAYLEDVTELCINALALFSGTPENENIGVANVMAGKLPDGWKMYDKYQIRHVDGTPLKGNQYFVLRLDSDDPSEAVRVSAAMSAYKGEAQHGNAAKLRKALGIVCDWILKAGHVQGYPDTEQKRRQLYDMMTFALAAEDESEVKS